MFDSLQEKLTKTLRNVQGKGKLSERNMEETLKEIRVALLESDVNYKVVKDFLEKVRQESIGQDVLNSVEPGQLLVKIVHDELIIAHTAIGLRDSHVLEELIAILVLDDDLDGVVAGADTNGDHRNGHVLVDQDILITLAIVLGIDAIVLGLGVEGLTHELLAGNVDIAEVGQRGHTGLLVAIVLERAAGDFVVILLAVVLTLEIDA